ncbi:MAG: hypothetical protein KJ676_10735 [Alphaproteobacteria bacterium]|nr:hypothetical protein [Alphaproteobacteria bacterium]MBU1526820.1 hypothetical protein [Alphaproteobacteria bacterium]MBU2118232.1 hypothetical protein [Alphaproteobacteria bacterium]MBU2351655.1 hypothetical protein [Alphaproteobacteria bacterium]MBU2381324.1 hypothetical protein [Alphaproteobacteria bacterium]
MRIAALVALGLVLAACQPVPAVEPAPGQTRPEVPATAEACRAAGGSWGPQGLLGRAQCVMPMPDAGKACRDGDDCVGDCRGDPEKGGAAPGDPMTGKCQATTSPFGCYTRIEDGRAEGMLCVD